MLSAALASPKIDINVATTSLLSACVLKWYRRGTLIVRARMTPGCEIVIWVMIDPKL